MNYPVELKMKILSEYEQGKVGYKLLVRKYGLKRDTIRYWVLTNKGVSREEEIKDKPSV